MWTPSREGRFGATALAVMIVSSMIAGVTAGSSDDVLHTFLPGHPGEPKWTMLALDSTNPDAEIRVQMRFIEVYCPFVWEFVLFHGSPEAAQQFRGTAWDFAYGRQGVHTMGPVELDLARDDPRGEATCASGKWSATFRDLPVGRLYLLGFVAGAAVRGEATATSLNGGVEVVGVSSGDRTHYITSEGYETQGAYAGVHSPAACGMPSVRPNRWFCAPNSAWAGGLAGGGNVGVRRSAEITFEHHPYFSFGPGVSRIEVENSSVTDPLGSVRYSSGKETANIAGHNVRTKPHEISTTGSSEEYPPGTYRFEIHSNANVGVIGDGRWRIHAVDYAFPEEQTGGRSGLAELSG